jgi:hypothetical protein
MKECKLFMQHKEKKWMREAKKKEGCACLHSAQQAESK